MFMLKRTVLHGALVAVGFALGSVLPAAAQEAAWPSKPIRVIVNFGPGGSADNTMRPYAERSRTGVAPQARSDSKR
jgi:tripartite-type tricarboxylate transporter receptor subunit TctC